jgi:hypothetical protein
MRYLILTYYRKASGQIDEVMAVSKNIKRRDLQTANVILDFKDQKVVKASMGDQQVPKDWDRIVAYYYQHYAHTIERLFEENGHPLNIVVDHPASTAETEAKAG